MKVKDKNFPGLTQESMKATISTEIFVTDFTESTFGSII